MKFTIPFNQPEIVGNELRYIKRAVELRNLAGDGPFTHACCRLLERRLGVSRVLLTPSGTAALELAAMLCDLRPGDEVIMPSFTFVSTANAAVRLGARPVFVDVRPDTLNLDETLIEDAIGPRTRAILPVHYAGVSCEMDTILRLARKYDLRVIEDAAQGVGSTYKGRALGSIGDMGAFSFHETKNYTCGEGGALCLNDAALYERAVILWNKGTDKHRQLAGRVRKYQWIDVGASYMPSELASAFLFAQLERMDEIAERRCRAWHYYYESLVDLQDAGFLRLPVIPAYFCVTRRHGMSSRSSWRRAAFRPSRTLSRSTAHPWGGVFRTSPFAYRSPKHWPPGSFACHCFLQLPRNSSHRSSHAFANT